MKLASFYTPWIAQIEENTYQKKVRIWTLFTQWLLRNGLTFFSQSFCQYEASEWQLQSQHFEKKSPDILIWIKAVH